MSKFTRRELAATLSTSVVLLARPQAPTPAAQPSNAAEELTEARAQLRANADELDKFPLPMDAEPATTFKP
jgi:hypothetical protein